MLRYRFVSWGTGGTPPLQSACHRLDGKSLRRRRGLRSLAGFRLHIIGPPRQGNAGDGGCDATTRAGRLPVRGDDEVNWLLAVSATVLVLVVVATVASVWLAHAHSLLRVTDVENDNADAIRHFLAVLGRAEREFLVHDDGTDGTLYDDEGTIEAVRERLRTCPTLKIRCLLNFNAGVKMAALSEETGGRFQVRYVHRRPVDDVHLKIADGGKMACLSVHPQGVTERRGQVVEDMGAPEFVRKRRLGGLIDDFNEGFEKAGPA